MSAQNPSGLHALVNELGKRLTLGESLDNRQLRELSNQFLGGTRAQGAWTPRDAYDALETAVNKFLFDTMAGELITTESEALAKRRTHGCHRRGGHRSGPGVSEPPGQPSLNALSCMTCISSLSTSNSDRERSGSLSNAFTPAFKEAGIDSSNQGRGEARLVLGNKILAGVLTYGSTGRAAALRRYSSIKLLGPTRRGQR
jgi:hypothetical protein